MFKDDLEVGKRAEKLVAAALAARGHKVIDVSDDREYQRRDIDFILESPNGQQTTLEVKNDLRSDQTGNVFIETYSANNYSRKGAGWYYYCDATYLAFVQEKKGIAHIVAFAELQSYIDNNNPRQCRSPFSEGYVIPIDKLKTFNSYFCLRSEC